MERKIFRTEISAFDREIGGGIPSKTVVTFSADPKSQAEVFLQELSMLKKEDSSKPKGDRIYITTEKSELTIKDAFLKRKDENEVPQIEELKRSTPQEINKLVQDIDKNSIIIIDSIGTVQKREEDYTQLLNDMKALAVRTDSIIILYQPQEESLPNSNKTFSFSDMIITIDTKLTEKELINLLSIPKFRFGEPLREPMKIELGQRVEIDTSRDIA